MRKLSAVPEGVNDELSVLRGASLIQEAWLFGLVCLELNLLKRHRIERRVRFLKVVVGDPAHQGGSKRA